MNEFDQSLGIASLVREDEVTVEARRLLSLPLSQLQKMGANACGNAAYVLSQFAFRIQQAVNREQGRVTWAEESINRIIGKVVGRYSGVSYQERRLKAIADNDAALKYDEIRVKAQLKIDRISFLANKAELLSKSMLALHNKRKED